MSNEELEHINAFVAAGCMVFGYNGHSGYYDYGNGMPPQDLRTMESFQSVSFDAATMLEYCEIEAVAHTENFKYIDAKLLKGELNNKKYQIAVVVNYHPLEKPVNAGEKLSVELETPNKDVKAVWMTPDTREDLPFELENDRIICTLPEITTGGFLFIGSDF